MLRTFHYYHAETGELHSLVFRCDTATRSDHADPAMMNAPSGHKPIEAKNLDASTQRVDVASGKVVDKQPKVESDAQ